jgi:hypothetical protein
MVQLSDAPVAGCDLFVARDDGRMASPSSALKAALYHRHQQMVEQLKVKGLDQTHEVQLLARNHMGEQILIAGIAAIEPDLLMLESRNADGTGETLIQSPGSINVTYRILPKQGSLAIGFSAL